MVHTWVHRLSLVPDPGTPPGAEHPPAALHRLLSPLPGVEHLTIREHAERTELTVFITGNTPLTVIPVIAEIRTLLADPHAVPGWRLRTTDSTI